ncbi:MAG: hypothetical protein RIQ89_1870 [Bacteroidota bacterium]|jgi:metallo-beta-lactamase family protein
MQISFHGAARMVTGTKHLITTQNGKNILLDCGMFQGQGQASDQMNRHFGFNPDAIDYLILSHAHIDHSGNIPYLVSQGFRGDIIATAATRDLCSILLADTAHIQQQDNQYLNKKRAKVGKPPLAPLYSIKDVEKALALFTTIPYQKVFQLDDQISVTFFDTGHILGAAAILLSIKEKGSTKRIFFSGDIGRSQDAILKSPQAFPQADVIICESTYGNRLHEPQEDREKKLLGIIKNTCVNQKGKLIIPAFSLGRTQELVYAFNNLKNAGLLPPIKVFVDSPLSINATNIMRAHPECFNEQMLINLRSDSDPFGFDDCHYIRKPEDSMKLNEMNEPMIIISASGMAEAGRIKHHIKNAISNEANTILLVGYCTPSSLGGRLARNYEEVNIFGKPYKVKANVEVMSNFSAHADYHEMLEYLDCQNKKEVSQMFLVHGEYETQIAWRDKLMDSGFANVSIPELHQSFAV